MTTTVRNIMMSFTLVGSMLLAAFPVTAQGRRGLSNGSTTMSTSRSSETRVSRERSSQNYESRNSRGASVAVSRASNDNRSASSMSTGRTRPTTGTTSVVTTQREDRIRSGYTSSDNNRTSSGLDRGNRDRNSDRDRNGGRDRDRNGNNRPGNNNDRNSNYGHNNDNRGHDNHGYDNRGHDNRGYDNRRHDNHGYDNRRHDNRGYDNRGHNAYRDHYSWNHAHNDWSRPLPPPARAHRPAPYRYHRPVIPAHWRPHYGAPVIDRILGITFGTMFNASLSYLYTNGYDIDGYDNGVVYLRNVHMMSLAWPDVMLCYDDYGRLINAQFIHSSYYNDRSRYNRLYHDLCAAYGSPIEIDGGGITWFGGNRMGYVTLSMTCTGSRYYTNLYIGS